MQNIIALLETVRTEFYKIILVALAVIFSSEICYSQANVRIDTVAIEGQRISPGKDSVKIYWQPVENISNLTGYIIRYGKNPKGNIKTFLTDPSLSGTTPLKVKPNIKSVTLGDGLKLDLSKDTIAFQIGYRTLQNPDGMGWSTIFKCQFEKAKTTKKEGFWDALFDQSVSGLIITGILVIVFGIGIYAVRKKNAEMLKWCIEASPMLGILGTVIGLFITFRDAAILENPQIKDLSSGMYTAILTTIIGLFFAFVLFVFQQFCLKQKIRENSQLC
jgi:hypothetical protein